MGPESRFLERDGPAGGSGNLIAGPDHVVHEQEVVAGKDNGAVHEHVAKAAPHLRDNAEDGVGNNTAVRGGGEKAALSDGAGGCRRRAADQDRLVIAAEGDLALAVDEKAAEKVGGVNA